MRKELDLAVAPEEPWAARNYPELYLLWKRFSRVAAATQDRFAPGFQEWERDVLALLKPAERDRFMATYPRDEPMSADAAQPARLHNLKMILWARKGLDAEK